jgi:hypothetical protein
MFKKIIFLLALIPACIYSQAIGPKVTIPQSNFDYSHVPVGTTLQHTYLIYNGGGGMLKLSGVNTSCKCIAASLDKTMLSPTDSARLDVTYTNNGKTQGLDNYVVLKTNDSNNPEVRIFVTRKVPSGAPTLASMPKDSISGSAVEPIMYLPETEHDFGRMKQGDVVSYVFKVVNKGTASLRIRDITTSCGCTAAVVNNKDIPAGKTGEISVQFDSAGKEGKLTRTITVFSSDPKNTYKSIKIYADVETGK